MGDQSWSRAAARPTKQRGLAPASTSASSQPTILLSVAGLSPQVVTESLYCLLVVQQPPADVREVRVVTTLAGAERVRRTLLDRRTGHLARFCREYGIPRGRIRFDAACILVPDGADGAPLADVRTPEDNGRMADAILALVRELTADPSRALHGSVAGGRKTMGLFLGIAFQLFARPQDRLSHVLVSPSELEGHPHFFFPPATPTTYQIAGRRVSSRDVRVELAEIPLLRLREQLAGVQLEELSYTELIREAQQELDRRAAPPSLLLRSVDRSLHIGGETVRLTTLEFALYSLLA